MKTVKILFDLFLLLAIVASIYFFFTNKKNTEVEWQNPFQKFPWKELQKLSSHHKKYSILIKDEKLTLQTQNKGYSISWTTFQKYMDNILILPEYQYFQKQDNEAAYGLENESITFYFTKETHVLKLGKNLVGDSSNFYLSLDGKLFTLPSVLRQNIDWPIQSFIAKTPIQSDFDQFILFSSQLQSEPIQIKRDKHQYYATNSIYPLKPYSALQKLFTMKAKVDLSPNVQHLNCEKFMQLKDQIIQRCQHLFYSPHQEISWEMDPNTLEHMKNFDLKLLSKQFSDFINISFDKVSSIQFPNQLVLKPTDKSFLYIIKLLKQSKISFETTPISKNQSFLFLTPNTSFQLNGIITKEGLFKFSIKDHLVGVLPFQKFQAIYQ